MVKLVAQRIAHVTKPSIATRAQSSRTSGARVARAEAKLEPSSLGCLAALVAVTLSVSAPDCALALEANERESDFVAGLLAKTDAKRDERKQERLNDYYRKNFGDYLKFESGNKALVPEDELTANDVAIRSWIEVNK